jgi:hypothetical protein
MTVQGARSNPDPDWSNTVYVVERGNTLLQIAGNVVQAEAEAKGDRLSGAAFARATAKELALIKDCNPQIDAADNIYPGDKIALPVQTPETPVPLKAAAKSAEGLNPPSAQGASGIFFGSHVRLTRGHDVLSLDGEWDLVMLPNGELALYELYQRNQRTENYLYDELTWQSHTAGHHDLVAYATLDEQRIVLHGSDGHTIKSIPVSTVEDDLGLASEDGERSEDGKT